MIEARWFSTVRWLMPRSAAMFLLGWPARTSSMISRWRVVRLASLLAASAFQAARWLESRDYAIARVTLARSSSPLTGFSMKSEAPVFIASTAMATSLLPVIMIAGR